MFGNVVLRTMIRANDQSASIFFFFSFLQLIAFYRVEDRVKNPSPSKENPFLQRKPRRKINSKHLRRNRALISHCQSAAKLQKTPRGAISRNNPCAHKHLRRRAGREKWWPSCPAAARKLQSKFGELDKVFSKAGRAWMATAASRSRFLHCRYARWPSSLTPSFLSRSFLFIFICRAKFLIAAASAESFILAEPRLLSYPIQRAGRG